MNRIKESYDVIIIGAGVGGLVCGAYLAKAGVKVAILEQQNKAGGYCGSFVRNNYIFDIGVHYLGGFGKKSFFNKIYQELGMNKIVKILRFDPTDIVIFPDFKVKINNNVEETKEQLKSLFPTQSENIEQFFNFILNADFMSLYPKYKNVTLDRILDSYFYDRKLRAVFNILLGNIGLPSSSVSAIAASILFRDYVFNGGYYTKGGMQSFIDALVKVFKEFGGDLILNEKIKKVILKNDKKIQGVFIDKKYSIPCKYVVLNSNMSKMQFETTKGERLSMLKAYKKLIPSCSAFIVYLGLESKLNSAYKDYHNVWYSPTYDTDNIYDKKIIDNIIKPDGFIFCSIPSLHDPTIAPPNNESAHLIVLAPYESRDYLHKHRDRIADILIQRVENFIPNFSKHIKMKITATPHTLERYTSNYKGALYGWASTPKQCDRNIFPSKTKLHGLYIVGHWTTLDSGQGGITMASYTGKRVAKNILKEMK